MKTLIKPATLLLISGILAGSVNAQEVKEKDKKDDKEKTIVIRPKADSKEKYTIVVDGDKVTINGKPVDEFKSDGIDITRRNDFRRFQGEGPLALGFSGPMLKGGWNMMRDNPFGNTNKALLGVVTQKADEGAVVENVSKESAAEKAGLKEGDIILKVDDIKIEDPEALNKAISKYNPDDKVTITYKRGGKEYTATATLGKNSTQGYRFNFDDRDFDLRVAPGAPDFRQFRFDTNRKPKLGLQIQDTEDNKGVKVLDVAEETPADKAGLKKDDIITSIDGKPVKDVTELKEVIDDIKEGDAVKIKYKRSNKDQTTEIRFPKKLKVVDL